MSQNWHDPCFRLSPAEIKLYEHYDVCEECRKFIKLEVLKQEMHGEALCIVGKELQRAMHDEPYTAIPTK